MTDLLAGLIVEDEELRSGRGSAGACAPSEGRKRAAAALGRSGARPRTPLGGWTRYSADWGLQ